MKDEPIDRTTKAYIDAMLFDLEADAHREGRECTASDAAATIRALLSAQAERERTLRAALEEIRDTPLSGGNAWNILTAMQGSAAAALASGRGADK